MSNKFTGFKYTGGGNLSLPGAPARNLTYDEVKELEVTKKDLLASGIYEEVPEEEPPTSNNKSETKTGGSK
jgi:hypothetical protein